MRINQKFYLFILLLFLLGGCVHFLGKTKSEESLRQKVNQEWEAKVHNDWGVIYDLTSKEFKQTVERNKFIQSASLKVLSFSIKEIKVDKEQGKAQATVNFDVNHMGLTFKGATLAEEWVWEDGEWKLNLKHKHTPFGK